MKKTLIMTLIIAMVLSIASVVNAAGSMAANPTKVKKGDQITVTVDFGKKMSASDFILTYDKNVLEFVSSTAEVENEESNGIKLQSYSKDTQSVTATFKAKKAGTTANIGFVANEFTNTELEVEEVTVNGVKVTIQAEEKKAEEPKEEEKEDDTIAKAPVPQTGMNVAAYAAVAGVVALAVAGVAVVGKKEDK